MIDHEAATTPVLMPPYRTPASTSMKTVPAHAASFFKSVYDISPTSIIDAAAGVEAEVYRVERRDAPALCLKLFRGPVEDGVLERTVLMDRLARRGLPFPRLHRTCSGEEMATFEGRAAVVLDWIEGATTDDLCQTSAASAATVLANMHDELAGQPLAPMASPPSWHVGDVDDMIERCQRLHDEAQRFKEHSKTDAHIAHALGQRIRHLRRAPELRRELPKMVLQQLHFDFTRPNLLFQGTDLVGVLDLRGMPGYDVWELGKLAFEPRTVASRRDWLNVALAAISAYQSCRRVEAVATVRTTVLYNLFSLWGVSERYNSRNQAVPTGYEDYWLDRHASTCTLLGALDEVEAAVARC